MTPLSRREVLAGLAVGAAVASAPAVVGGTSDPLARTDDAERPLADPAAFEAFLDDLVRAQLDAHGIPGATVAVVDGESTFTKGYGVADVEAGAPVSADRTLFRVGSVSKLFAWTAVMQGVERGALDLDADVNRYLDGLAIPETYDDPITLEHLATHAAGFEDRVRGTYVTDADAVRPLAQTLAAERPERVRPPGQFTAYSNFGAALAAHVAATAGGTSFERLVADEIFDPLAMDRSTFAQPVPAALRDDLATGYAVEDGEFRAGEFEYVGLPPTGAMSATATDVASFLRAHLRGGAVDGNRILDPGTITEMHRRRFANDERLNGMAFGFYELSRRGVRVIGHEGDTPLFHSLLCLLPDRDAGVFVSYNAPGGVAAREEFLDAFVDRYFAAGEPPVSAPDGRPTRAADVEGTYRALRVPYTTAEKFVGVAETVSVSVDDRGRLVTTSGGETRRWVEAEPLLFAEVGGTDRLAFRDGGGEITHLFLGSRPASAYERLSVLEQPRVHAVLLALSLLVFATALVGWPAEVAWRRYRGATRPRPDALPRLPLLVGGTAATCFLLFAVGFAAALVLDPFGFLYGDRFGLRLLSLLAAVGAVATVLALVVAGRAVRDRAWSRRLRAHYALVAVAGVVFAALLWYWNFLPYHT
ncbi:serine hydrolase domain-containing protein [Salinilacihabitans rarus]|uniref:serine hydrolase domain-containing protein n=1 Tax=Salinilacihabitans rarus TaxID=2961596 RepID=UPI0020C8D353|nr:serine hydrolase domain-containing protein [Salinilacihabitans rarus]